MSRRWILLLCAGATLTPAAAPPRDQITRLYDSHAAPKLASGWGYSALVEYRGKRILFDAGPSASALEQNSKALGIDLGKLDAVVISHDDPDHYGGLEYLHWVNPGVAIYVPEQEAGAFSPSIMNRLLRYIQGSLPRQHVVDAPSGANYIRLASGKTLFPGVRLILLPFDNGQRREQALVLDVPGGVAMLTGCAHPGVVALVKNAGPHVRLATGGFHLINSTEQDVRRTVQELQQAGVESVYPAHCTGTFATLELRRVYRDKCEIVAAGSIIPLPR